jgi:branched-chain amino acid transport system ATP-binding protein
MLELQDLSVRYGAIEAVRSLSLQVDSGEIVTLIGGNGAGKTTTLKTISGVLRSVSGTISFEGERIDRLRPHEIVSRGVCQAPEGRHIFPRMTVRENLEMGAFGRNVRTTGLSDDFDRVFTLFPILKERLKQAGGTLSGGEQQMLAIGRALMARPRLLLLDEPSMGLAPQLVDLIFSIIVEINRQGIPILLIEQNAQMALQTANRGYVIETGEIVLHDEASKLLGNDLVRRSYLGE